MNHEDVEIIERTTGYRGHYTLNLYRFRHRLHAGGWSGEVRREVFERGHAAAVLPYDPVADTVLLIEQFRIPALVANCPAWQIEVVAGIIEPGEIAEDVARREAVEEADCTILDLEPIHRFLVSPGAVTETVALFCGRMDSTGLGGLHGLAHEQEDIKVSVVAAADAIALVAQQRIGNATSIIALQWLALHREALRRRWLAPAALR